MLIKVIAWCVEIDSNKFFTGTIIIKAETGKIAKEVVL